METNDSISDKDFAQTHGLEAHIKHTNDNDAKEDIIYGATGGSDVTQETKTISSSSDSKESVQKQEARAKTKHTNGKGTDEGIISGATGSKDITQETEDTIDLEYSFVDTDETLKDCLEKLRDALKDDPMLAVDCEGDNLSRDGKVQILSVATNTEVFLVDVGALKSAPFDMGLRAMLEDKNIKKLMFDCREDADALLHQYRVSLDGVLDIQLLEIIKRPPTEQTNIPSRRSARLYEVSRLKGLKDCIAMHIEKKGVLGIKKHGVDLKEKWGMRPLAKEALQYAATDVLALFRLFEKMHPNEEEMERLRIASGIYVDLKRSKAVRTNDEYEHNCYLPIDVVPVKAQTCFARGFTSCIKCSIYFPRDEFSNSQLRQGDQKCRTCKQVKKDIDVQKNREDNWARSDARDLYYFNDRESDYFYDSDSDEDLFGGLGLRHSSYCYDSDEYGYGDDYW